MAIEWTSDLETGVQDIDDQHKELFSRINSLLDSCNQGKGKQEVSALLLFLEEYVLIHFDVEEKIMRGCAYPGYSEHKAKHIEFTKNFVELKRKVETEGVGVQTVISLNSLVVRWFTDHIRGTDKKLGAFLASRPRGA